MDNILISNDEMAKKTNIRIAEMKKKLDKAEEKCVNLETKAKNYQ